jgi:hypothetical protein
MQEGVLPINLNLNDDSNVQKGQFLFLAKSVDDCILILEQMESILPFSWHYDSD